MITQQGKERLNSNHRSQMLDIIAYRSGKGLIHVYSSLTGNLRKANQASLNCFLYFCK